jgi:hypothetical protein
MSDHITPNLDSLSDILAPPPLPADDRLHDPLRERTTGVVRWRRHRRQVLRVAALAACFAAGMLVAHRPAPPPPPEGPAVATPQPDLPELPPRAVALEWQALDHPDARAAQYRAAGDRYLAEEGDLAAAVRCYRGALDAGTAADLQISPEDNWLLMALKDARRKERRNATNPD